MDIVTGFIALSIVAACWLYVHRSDAGRPFVFRRSARIARAERGAREALRRALATVKERI